MREVGHPSFLFLFACPSNCAFNDLPLVISPSPQYGAEFRRFSVDRVKPGKFEEFYKLILHIHRIANMEVMIGYADIHGDLLPINNDDNFCKAVSTAHPLLRIFIQRQGRLSEKFLGRHAFLWLFLTFTAQLTSPTLSFKTSINIGLIVGFLNL